MDYRNFDENESLAMLLDRSTRDLGISLQRIFKDNGFDITVEQWMILLLLWKKNGRLIFLMVMVAKHQFINTIIIYICSYHLHPLTHGIY